jgi:hypothetical protein
MFLKYGIFWIATNNNRNAKGAPPSVNRFAFERCDRETVYRHINLYPQNLSACTPNQRQNHLPGEYAGVPFHDYLDYLNARF